jgi:hypothetical protein
MVGGQSRYVWKEGALMVNGDNGAWWSKEWGSDELEDELLAGPTLWEAEVAALSDEQLAAMEETTEDM